MTVPQMFMVFLGMVTIACFVISWLALTHEEINKKANRLAYKLSENQNPIHYYSDHDYGKAPEWADIAKFEDTRL